MAKEDVANESTERDCNHNPTVVCHEDEPRPNQLEPRDKMPMATRHLHEHKGVKVLKRVNGRLGIMVLAAGLLCKLS